MRNLSNTELKLVAGGSINGQNDITNLSVDSCVPDGSNMVGGLTAGVIGGLFSGGPLGAIIWGGCRSRRWNGCRCS